MHLMKMHNDSLASKQSEDSNALVPYFISREKRQKLDVHMWLEENRGDPALKVCFCAIITDSCLTTFVSIEFLCKLEDSSPHPTSWRRLYWKWL